MAIAALVGALMVMLWDNVIETLMEHEQRITRLEERDANQEKGEVKEAQD